MSTTEAFHSGSFGFKLIGTTVADGSSRVEVLVPEGKLETTGGGAEVANGRLESSRKETAQERPIIFKAYHGQCIAGSRLYRQNALERSIGTLRPQLTQVIGS